MLGCIIWSPYTGEQFSGTKETEMEHIAATSEAHDSDLCAHGVGTRRDLLLDCKPAMLYIASQENGEYKWNGMYRAKLSQGNIPFRTDEKVYR